LAVVTVIERGNHFNLLRLAFACLVIAAHCPEIVYGDRNYEPLTMLFGTLSFGDLAVDGFFLLSGYLIVKSWMRRPNWTVFLTARARRILPGFIVSALLCALVVGPLGGGGDYFERFSLVDFASSLVTLAQPMIPPVFSGTHYPIVNGSVWTIVYEVRCYVAVLLFGLLGGFRVRFAWLGATVICLVFFMLARFDAWPLPGTAGQHMARFFMLFGVGGCFWLYGRPLLAHRGLVLPAAVLLALLISLPRWAELGVALFGGYLFCILRSARQRRSHGSTSCRTYPTACTSTLGRSQSCCFGGGPR
jgi:peptidoglycan/LPS O-acetylase OafA/YrhL